MQFDQLKRREFITLVGCAAAAWPLAARAQQPDRTRRIGALFGQPETDSEAQARADAIRQGLQELGWTEGRNLHIEYRWAGGGIDRQQPLAAELVRLNPEVIFAAATTALVALQQATRTIPIVFAQVTDPVGAVNRELIIALAARHRLPSVYAFRYHVVSGGLASYGVDNIDLYRRAAWYVDRILKGEKAADLPVQHATKFQLVINLKTANALGLDPPITLLARTDEVIE